LSGRWEGEYKKPNIMTNTTSAPEMAPARTVASYYNPTLINLSAVKGSKITPEECKRQREGGLCIYCGNSRYFAASCSRKLKAVAGQVEVIPFRDSGKGKEIEVEKELELEKE
jgi:hypothetical protein